MSYSVRISGTVLSCLLYECANSLTDIEGFFLGALSKKTVMTNDDASAQAFEKREDFIIIHGFQLLKEKPYDIQGNIIKKLVTSQQKDLRSIVGYFKFRRQTEVTLSVRDQLWMNSYAANIPHGCIAIISSNLNTDKTTHTYEFAFWDMKNKEKKLPINITNMAESTQSYKTFMSNAPHKLIESSNNQILARLISPDTIIKQYDQLFEESMSSLKKATESVREKEEEIARLKQEIERLKDK